MSQIPKKQNPPELLRFLEHSNDILVEYDRSLRYVWINQTGAKLLGLTLEEAIGKTNRELIGSAAEHLEIILQEVFKKNEKVQVDWEINLPSGTRIYNSIYTPITDPSGAVTSVIGVCRDITELRALQQTSEQMLAAAYNQVEQRKVLAEVIARIRKPLDLDRIFTATAKEVRQLLKADRVAVYQFYLDSGYNDGEFVSEDGAVGLPSALEARVRDSCFGERYAVHYEQGQIQAVADIYNAGLSDCHIHILSQFQVKANLVVPLLKAKKLWGLLCIHQCTKPRHWQATEIEFVTQIADHLGVALEQIELLAQTRASAAQLAQALQDLQRTQAQLIQTEKMSSLGHLVAGVAHEINNPVNFIYGNLTHASDYTNDLLDLLHLYQRYCTHPHSEIQERSEEIDLEFIANDLPKLLNSMKVGADRIRQLVLSLRNFSRLDQSQIKLVDIHEGLDSALLILQHRLKGKIGHLAIQTIKNYGKLPLVECYPSQLNQVFMNILCNAIDVLENQPDPRSITIRTSIGQGGREGGEWGTGGVWHNYQYPMPLPQFVTIQIADNGPGISEAVKAHIFDPFFTTKEPGKGTGLGLAISYQIVVEKHAGVLHCISQPGQGAEFLIAIPVRQPGNSQAKN
ncbi:PAS domain-containing sensor histidine kinase [Aerosakkonema funiforme]|uniref:histidine kinase n=2 Tax=Oscillatoriophycideae TaxID=1301283 RepID=A0A926VAU8_9CYAN|nr:GAF domain-containing protein [Aerosakkonema funiforme]MBD2180422.1 GAF domain-containing protein [Aerosakkonema funiforme FACHB-1375]